MRRHDLLVIGLDGFDIGYAGQLMDAGDLPALTALRDRSARFLLDPGEAARTGLAWEHFASGMTPERAPRSSMVELVGTGYNTVQRGTRLRPFFASLDARTVVFDAPYTDISQAPSTRGIVAWGGHAPGVGLTARPPELLGEIDRRFGEYPAKRWIYDIPWASAQRAAEMGAGLVHGLATRREVARWLLTERFADWDLAIVVAAEPHAAAEALWHGVDPTHPLHGHASAGSAAQGLADLYREADRFVGELVASTEPRSLLVFSLDGMGTNDTDTASIVLLPELVYRWATGDTLLDAREWSDDPRSVPLVLEGQTWGEALAACYPATRRSFTTRLASRTVAGPRRVARLMRSRSGVASQSLEWMPASRYRSQWATMRAFALPSYFDGRIRVNLRGREPAGVVDLADYTGVCDELEAVLRACQDPRTGEPVVDYVARPGSSSPLTLGNSDADLVVAWRAPTCAFLHPQLGLVGPVPLRRTGGHTGPFGFAYAAAERIRSGDGGIRSAGDVAPTIAAMLDLTPPVGLDGTSMLATAARSFP